MATLNETIEQVQNVFNDIEDALQEQGVDTSELKPVDYAGAVRGIINESVKEIGIFPAIIFTYSKKSEIPTTPVGGKGVIDPDNKNGRIVPPDGGYLDLNEVEDVSTTSDQIGMSAATFKNDGEIYTNGITPFRISGKDGKDGKNGEQGVPGPVVGTTQYFYTPYYIEVTDDSTPSVPSGTYVDGFLENVTQGGTTSITETNYQGTGGMSTASYNSSMTNGDPVSFTIPVRISTTSADRKQGTTRYYILSDSPKIPTITDSNGLMWVDGVAPTLQKPYLFCKDVTSYSQSDTETSPPYLLTTYSNGLKSIDFDYTCGESKDVVTSESHPWFNSTEEALTDNPETGYLGLTKETKFLGCREKFIYVDETQNESFYRILSSYTAAEKAAIIYSAGVFNPNVIYTRTEEQRPYIYYPEGLKLNSDGEIDKDGNDYYYFVLKYSYDDDFHRIDINSDYTFESAYINGNGEKMESFDAIYSDIGLFKAANVGQFIFDDRYIFSQLGKDKSGNIRKYEEFTEYPEGFDVVIPDDIPEDSRRTGIAFAIECGDFIPNILLNAITGEAKFGGGTSVLKANGSGYLAGGRITGTENGDALFGDKDGFISFEDGALSLSGSVEIGVNAESLSGGEAFASVKDELIEKANDAKSEAIDDAEKKLAAAEEKLSASIDEAKEIANTANAATETLDTKISDIETEVNKSVAEINKRLDGVVENYFEEGVPTTENYPASEWTTEEERANHVGDTYTNILSHDDDHDDAGKSWRWTYTDSEHTGYHWHPIADSDAVKALLEASKAQTTADGKSRNFVTEPYPPYSVGDLWIQGPDGDTKRCIKTRETGSYTASDWELSSKYTDDTKAKEAMSEAKAAKSIADNAKETADAAKTVADTASENISDMKYLKDALGDVSHLSVKGVVMSQMVAVADVEDGNAEDVTEANIKAFLNGSDFAKDTEVDPHTEKSCGKLILAAGIPETVEKEDATFEDRAKEATTRIYEDGCTYTKNLHLQEGCTIGNIKVDNNGILVRGEIGNDAYSTTSLNDTFGLVSERRGEYGNNYGIRLGGTCDGVALRIGYGNESAFMGNCLGQSAALHVDCSVDEVPAICIPQGMFAGLRPKVRTITDSTELNNNDHTLVIHSSSDLVITLPSHPILGQEYLFINSQNSNTTVKHTIKCWTGEEEYDGEEVLINNPSNSQNNIETISMNAHGRCVLTCALDNNGEKKWGFSRLC